MIPALEVRAISRRFGDLRAVEGLSLSIAPGEICGFIGPNGAGKTTTMRICATLDLPDEGDVFVEGTSVLVEPRMARARLGFMPDAYGAYPATTVAEYLDFYARAYGLRGARRSRTIAGVVEFTGLGELLAKEMRSLSKGMKQRLCLAKTMLHDPALFLLDEPASGLDPRARVELRELVRQLARMGKAVLVSSHILAELGELCDTVAILERGRLLAHGPIGAVSRAARPHLVLRVRALADSERLRAALLERPQVEAVRSDEGAALVDFSGGEEEAAELLAALVRAGLRPVEFRAEEADLEAVFLSITKGEVQ